MGMRITTSMMMNTYRYNLQGSTRNLSDARNKVLSHRNFDSYAEDPASATKAWRIRRAMASNFDYQANNDDTYSRFSIASTTMGVVNHDLEDLDGRFSTIRGVSGTAGAGRQPLGQVLDKSAETIIQAMNSAKYGDHFVFSGDDEMNAPFSWSDDMKTLYYRGVNVGAGAVKNPGEPPKWTTNDLTADGLPEGMPDAGADEWEQAWVDYYQDQKKVADGDPAAQNLPKPSKTDPSEVDKAKWGEKDRFGVPANAKEILTAAGSTAEEKAWAAYLLDQGDVAKLKYMAEEEQNVDLGMGLQEDDKDVLINGTAFNRALPGINMLGGYGVDEDGDPKNVVLITKRLGELLSNADPDSGAWDADPAKADEIHEEAMRLLDKLNAAHHRTTDAYTEVETKAHFLQTNQTRLETQGDYLQEERVNIEQVDLADAITEFFWDYYCYSAALKIGNQLLSQTLIDYMT